ncbi:MAG TPA: DNA polymerase III subunit beta, partial [Actinomycetota bacterium]|nr:DNA polymerase III subunit beta [Actinomycetota bacterium]
MNFRCERDVLAEALATAQRGVSPRPGIAALTGVMLEAGSEGLTVTTTDLEVTTQVRLAVEVAEEGSALIPARLVAEMVKSLPPDDVDI